MAFKVVQVWEMPGVPDYAAIFRDAGIDVDFSKRICPSPSSEDDIIAQGREADAVITVGTHQPFSRRVIERLPSCRFIMSIGIGFERVDVAAATEHDILVATTPDSSVEEVSDHTMALILACTRRIVELNSAVKAGRWRRLVDPELQREIVVKSTRLRGKTLGLIGLGRTPRALVSKVRGFGMEIVAYSPHVDRAVFQALGVTEVSLDELLERSDVVSVHTALTAETKGLIGPREFRMMKTSACLINTARGPIVDHDALYQALSQGIIAAAAVDVTDPEPLAADSPLLRLDNFIVTPHVAYYSRLAFDEQMRRPAEEVIRVVHGEWPIGLLNPEVKERYVAKWCK